MLRRFLKDEAGATAVIFALAIPVFIGGIVFAVELGHWHQNKSKLQDMADTTAIAAAQEINLLAEDADYEFAGKGHAFENGFNYLIGDVLVSSPPVSGKYAGRADMVEVNLNRLQTMYFAQYFGNQAFDIKTRATAVVLEGRPVCVLAVNTSEAATIDMGGNASVDVENCALHSNSSNPNAITTSNNTSITGECVSAAGGINVNGNINTNCEDSTQPYSGRAPDPFRNVSIPDDVNSMPCTRPSTHRGNVFLDIPNGDDSVRICQNMSTNGLIEFRDPGIYYIDGASLGTRGNNSLIFGRDVTIVFLNGGSFDGANSGDINITPQTSGPMAGISMYFDPATTGYSEVTINGNNNSLIEGVVYAPTLDLQINGGANVSSRCTLVVANTVEITGGAGFTNTDCEALGIDPITTQSGVALVE